MVEGFWKGRGKIGTEVWGKKCCPFGILKNVLLLKLWGGKGYYEIVGFMSQKKVKIWKFWLEELIPGKILRHNLWFVKNFDMRVKNFQERMSQFFGSREGIFSCFGPFDIELNERYKSRKCIFVQWAFSYKNSPYEQFPYLIF